MEVLSKEQILAVDDRKTEVVSVPEWGGDVIVGVMSGTERDAFEQSVVDTGGGNVTTNLANIRAKLCARCIVDADGKRVFNNSDIVALGEKSSAALDRIFGIAQRLNGLTADEVEQLAKNSSSDQSGSSTSD